MNPIRERLRFAFGSTPIGQILLAISETGIRWLSVGDNPAEMEHELRSRFPRAMLVQVPDELSVMLEQIRAQLEHPTLVTEANLDPVGTEFQKSVWSLLRQIPSGSTITYGELAKQAGNPKSVRAVAQACGANPILLLVPCHRVIGANGALTGFRAGLERKRWLLEQEGAIKP